MNPNTPGKQVIYVDVDDEITAIIDKINATSARVIALVLPKRSTVFQSVVNMKLLKRRADSAKKNIVLITSETALMPLAGIAGLYVAPTLQSKPEVPAVPANGTATEDEDHEETATVGSAPAADFNAANNAAAPIGALAGDTAGVATTPGLKADDGAIELDNTAKTGLMGKLKGSSDADKAKANGVQDKADKKLKVPNFFSFRKKLFLGGLVLVLLIVGWYFAYFVLPKATITISTDSSDITTNMDITLDTAATKADFAKATLPAQTKQEQKSSTQQVPATGQQNKGSKAIGTVVMTATVCGTPAAPNDVPAGTGITSNNAVFITQKTASFSFDSIGGGCIKFKSPAIDVVAQNGGANYNINGGTFTVRADVTASGTTTGGTDNNVKVVQQSDIDAAKAKLAAEQDENALKNQLKQELEDSDLIAIVGSFSASTPNVNTNNNVGDEAENVTVTQAITYTMFGVKKRDVSAIIDASADKQIDKNKQSILNNGVDGVKLAVTTPGAGPQLKGTLVAVSTAGPKLDVDALKKEMAGLKSGNVKDKLKQHIGVKDVDVKYSPFWVTKAPKAERITIVFEKTGHSTDESQ